MLAVAFLDPRLAVLGHAFIGIGTQGGIAVDPAEVFRPAIHIGARALILYNINPYGAEQPTPSEISFTAELIRIGRILDVYLIDHILITLTKIQSVKTQLE